MSQPARHKMGLCCAHSSSYPACDRLPGAYDLKSNKIVSICPIIFCPDTVVPLTPGSTQDHPEH